MNSSSVSLRRPVVAVRVADVPDLGDERLERRAQRLDPVDRERAERRAVVRDLRARSPCTSCRAARPSRAWKNCRASFHAASTASEPPEHEEDAVEVAGRERRDLGGELDRARVRVRPVRVEGQLLHLLVRGLPDLVPEAVAEVDGEEPRERVEVAVALVVLEVAAVAADDDRRRMPAHPREVEPEMVARELPKISCCHVSPSRRAVSTSRGRERSRSRRRRRARGSGSSARAARCGRRSTTSTTTSNWPAVTTT